MKRSLLAVASLASLGSALGCNPTGSVQALPPPNKITMSAGNSGTGPGKTVVMSIGDTISIVYGVADIFGVQTGVQPFFISRDVRVVTVTDYGLLYANGTGQAYVAAFVNTTGNNFTGDSILVNVSGGCTQEARAGITIAVQDSLTGSPGPFTNVSYVAKDTSTFNDSTFIATVPASVSGSTFLVGLAYEHAGSYTVTIRAAGYKPWIKTTVAVLKDACHVIPVSLTARLAPQ